MRLTLQVIGLTLTLALEQGTETEPEHGDLFAVTERAEVLDFDRTPIGFASSNLAGINDAICERTP